MTEVITTPESKVTKSESVGAKAIEPGDSVAHFAVNRLDHHNRVVNDEADCQNESEKGK